jgi:hypothetical protein
MKKIITLFVAALAFTASFAQTTSQEESRRVILGKQKKGNTEQTTKKEDGRTAKDIILGRDERTTRNDDGTYTSAERQAEIDRINREYDSKIQSIRNNPTLSAEEKERMIRGLENERARKIRQVNNAGKDRDDDKDGKKDKVKGNNGKHLGWEKGVGNPHRSDSDKQIGKDKSKDRDDDRSKGKEKSKSKGKGKKG